PVLGRVEVLGPVVDGRRVAVVGVLSEVVGGGEGSVERPATADVVADVARAAEGAGPLGVDGAVERFADPLVRCARPGEGEQLAATTVRPDTQPGVPLVVVGGQDVGERITAPP